MGILYRYRVSLQCERGCESVSYLYGQLGMDSMDS